MAESYRHYLLVIDEYVNANINKLPFTYNLKTDYEYFRLLAIYDGLRRNSPEYIAYLLPTQMRFKYNRTQILDFFNCLLGGYETDMAQGLK